MDLLQLEHFLAVAEEGTFTRAARRVARTQPAISQSIKKLEEELGAPLFSREPNDVVLTDGGRRLLEYARKMVQMRDDAVREIGMPLTNGMLDIAAHESAAVYLPAAPLRHYVTQFPDVRVGIYRNPLTEIPGRVLDREVHIGFVKDPPAFDELKCIQVHSDEMILIVSPQHPLAGRRNVRVKDLANERLVVHHLCSSTEHMIMRLFEENATPCRIAAELWSFENIKNFVLAGVGAAIVPGITVARELRDKSLVRVPVAELSIKRRTHMIYRDNGLPQAARDLANLVQQFDWA